MSDSIVTNIAKKKIVQARAGLIPDLPKTIGMAFGDGAASGSAIRRPRANLAGQTNNEVALYDEDGDLLAIKAFSNKGKDGDMEMVFEILDKF